MNFNIVVNLFILHLLCIQEQNSRFLHVFIISLLTTLCYRSTRDFLYCLKKEKIIIQKKKKRKTEGLYHSINQKIHNDNVTEGRIIVDE